MLPVRTKEEQAEALAHVLDDMMILPGTHFRMGIDPLLGSFPVIGDTLATLLGGAILVFARQLDVPWKIVTRMAVNQWKNGLLGAVPFVGDAYSFYFKSNAVNAALMLRTIKGGKEGNCPLTTRPLTLSDIAGLAILIVPVIVLVTALSSWFWNHNISYVSLLFPPPYLTGDHAY
ncbi:MAG TPA: DUF4112 domain-containing protein [Nitrospira sp.]|nr:DUF4112 domain-containing protein [Nitrospira sp.]